VVVEARQWGVAIQCRELVVSVAVAGVQKPQGTCHGIWPSQLDGMPLQVRRRRLDGVPLKVRRRRLDAGMPLKLRRRRMRLV